jgi:hypothetical protein
MDRFRSATVLLMRIRAFALPILLLALVVVLAGCDNWFP